MSSAPPRLPIGVKLAGAAKAVSRAFDDALVEAGGSRSLWLILLSLKTRQLENQQELAAAVGIQGATLTHHLNGMEAEGLVTRRRDPDNRRVHLVELTARGHEAFSRMRGVVHDFDRRLRRGLSDEEIARLGQLLDRLQGNVAPPPARPALSPRASS